MFIQTENTPNPNTVKFVPGKEVLVDSSVGVGGESRTLEFVNVESASKNLLAKMIFENDGIAGVMLGKDFISVTKKEGSDWNTLKPLVLGTIMEYFLHNDNANSNANANSSDGIVVGDAADDGNGDEIDPSSLSEVEREIFELINSRVRPAVAMDGGDIVFKGFKDGVVFLQMKGACSGCPSSNATLKVGIENMLKHYIPEVLEVRAA